jgi:5-methylcytosine-specific restriction endonuclease McrA
MDTKTCNTCQRELAVELFHTNGYWTSKTGRHRKYHARCKDCWQQGVHQRFYRKLESMGVVLKCTHCGFDKYKPALDFHHVDPKEKDIIITKLRDCSPKRLEAEVKKCIVLCANCHRAFHSGLIVL